MNGVPVWPMRFADVRCKKCGRDAAVEDCVPLVDAAGKLVGFQHAEPCDE